MKIENNELFGFKHKIGLRIIFSLPVFIIAIVIFLLSHTPHPEFPKIGIVWEDKIAHLIAYFIFGGTIILFILSNSKKLNFKYIAIVSIIIGSFYGLSDEFHQYFIAGRDAEFFDWVADIAGISLSLLLIKTLKNKLIKQYV
ncbi:MAG: VanZ family protein [bacterium]